MKAPRSNPPVVIELRRPFLTCTISTAQTNKPISLWLHTVSHLPTALLRLSVTMFVEDSSTELQLKHKQSYGTLQPARQAFSV